MLGICALTSHQSGFALIFVVSATSNTLTEDRLKPCRTADEDFGMLLEAAVMYDRRVAALLGESDAAFLNSSLEAHTVPEAASPFPRLLFVVTGKFLTLAMIGQILQ